MESKTPRTLSEPKSYTDLEYAVMYKDRCEKLEAELVEARAEIEHKDLKIRQLDIECDVLTKRQREDKASFANTLQRLSQEIERKDELVEQMRTTLIATKNDLLRLCDDDPDYRTKMCIDFIDSALEAAERGG